MQDNRIYMYLTGTYGMFTHDILYCDTATAERFTLASAVVSALPKNGLFFLDLIGADSATITHHLDQVQKQTTKKNITIVAIPAKVNSAWFLQALKHVKKIIFVAGKIWYNNKLTNKAIILLEFTNVVKGMPAVDSVDLTALKFTHSDMCRLKHLKNLQAIEKSYF